MKFKKLLLVLVGVLMMGLLTSCSKDGILRVYDEGIQWLGNFNLTRNFRLEGKRSFGEDRYVGDYIAVYDDFSGREILFGGTGLAREAGETLAIGCEMDVLEGEGRLMFESGNEIVEVLLDESGVCDETVLLLPATNLIVFEGEGFVGNLEVNIK